MGDGEPSPFEMGGAQVPIESSVLSPCPILQASSQLSLQTPICPPPPPYHKLVLASNSLLSNLPASPLALF
jgi:hypothetical protein